MWQELQMESTSWTWVWLERVVLGQPMSSQLACTMRRVISCLWMYTRVKRWLMCSYRPWFSVRKKQLNRMLASSTRQTDIMRQQGPLPDSSPPASCPSWAYWCSRMPPPLIRRPSSSPDCARLFLSALALASCLASMFSASFYCRYSRERVWSQRELKCEQQRLRSFWLTLPSSPQISVILMQTLWTMGRMATSRRAAALMQAVNMSVILSLIARMNRFSSAYRTIVLVAAVNLARSYTNWSVMISPCTRRMYSRRVRGLPSPTGSRRQPRMLLSILRTSALAIISEAKIAEALASSTSFCRRKKVLLGCWPRLTVLNWHSISWSSSRVVPMSFSKTVTATSRLVLLVTVVTTTPISIVAKITSSTMLSTHRGRGVLRERSFSLNSLTWLVIEMKVALLEAELKVSLSSSLLAASSFYEAASSLLISSSVSVACCSGMSISVLWVSQQMQSASSPPMGWQCSAWWCLPISRSQVQRDITPSSFRMFLIRHRLYRTLSFLISAWAPLANLRLCSIIFSTGLLLSFL